MPELRSGTVRVEPRFTGICGTDLSVWHGSHSRATAPVTLGHEFSGIVVATGAGSSLDVGARVFVEPVVSCGECTSCRAGDYNVCSGMGLLGIDLDGSLAESIVVDDIRVHSLPEGVPLESAAFVEPLAVVCHLLRRAGGVRTSDEVLITGAGPIGVLTAAVVRARGAHPVLSDPNTFRADAARALGFAVAERPDGDVRLAVEASGNAVAFTACLDAVRPLGTIAVVGLTKTASSLDLNSVIAKEVAIVGSRIYTREDVTEALDLIADGTIRPGQFVSRVVSFDDAITEGFEFLDTDGRAVKVLIRGLGA
jgi:threonine dehydrogenase-like Zn-dependent dehydrogenase